RDLPPRENGTTLTNPPRRPVRADRFPPEEQLLVGLSNQNTIIFGRWPCTPLCQPFRSSLLGTALALVITQNFRHGMRRRPARSYRQKEIPWRTFNDATF